MALVLAFSFWIVICLFDHWLISTERVDISALYDRYVHSGCWILCALVCRVIGSSVEIPFVAHELNPAPLVDNLGGAASAGRGLVVATAIYYLWRERHRERHRRACTNGLPHGGNRSRETRQIMIDPVVA